MAIAKPWMPADGERVEFAYCLRRGYPKYNASGEDRCLRGTRCGRYGHTLVKVEGKVLKRWGSAIDSFVIDYQTPPGGAKTAGQSRRAAIQGYKLQPAGGFDDGQDRDCGDRPAVSDWSPSLHDEVEFETEESLWWPRWSDSSDRGGSGVWERGIVTMITDSHEVLVSSIQAGQATSFSFSLSAIRAGRPGGLRLAGPSTNPPGMVHSERVATVILDTARIPASVLNDAEDKGQRWIRRNMRSWPYNQKLKRRIAHDVNGTRMDWAFFPDEEYNLARSWV